jgi:hypothetical protein
VPWGFQSNAILSTAFSSFLIVCPMHFHFRFFNLEFCWFFSCCLP